MALVRNIAGFQVGALPQQSPTQTIPSSSSASGVQALYGLMNTYGPAVANAIVPGSGALIQVQGQLISLLPPGGFKNFANDIRWGPIPALIKLIAGLPYTEGQGKLAERFSDHILGNADIGYRDPSITTDMIRQAQFAFTNLFGVRITTGEDLDALDYGADAYYSRPDKSDIPRAAVDRAVMLKQNFYPISTYNHGPWNLDYFGKYPLVSPIPDPWQVGKLYTGPLPGGGNAVNGLLYAGEPSMQTSGGVYGSANRTNWALWAGAALLLYAGYDYYQNS